MENAVLNNYYADMNDREEAARLQERMAEIARDEAQGNVAFIAELDAAYIRAKEETSPELAAAFGTLAAHFYDPGLRVRSDDAADYNALGFQQRGFLGNMCQNAHWMLENVIKHEDKLWAELDALEAQADDTEISNRNIEICANKIEAAKMIQKPACVAWFAKTKAAYAAICGEEWKPFTKRGADAKTQTRAALHSRISALRES